MRNEMKPLEGSRNRFQGTFERYGWKDRYKPIKINGEWQDRDRTVLLKDIRDNEGKIITDHLWFNHTKGFQTLGEISPGDQISFDARVTKYVKGYVNHREGINEKRCDYRLSHPTKIALIAKGEEHK